MYYMVLRKFKLSDGKEMTEYIMCLRDEYKAKLIVEFLNHHKYFETEVCIEERKEDDTWTTNICG